jgi:hypothetical protein
MIPTLHQKTYQKFQMVLQALREEIESPNSRVAAISEKFVQVQQVFQQEIMSLTSDELAEDEIARFVKVQTEMHRNIRLLGTDLMFLRSSKQATTSTQRSSTVRDRLNNLMGFCQVMLTYGSNSDTIS